MSDIFFLFRFIFFNMEFWKLVVNVIFVCLFNFWVKIAIIKISDLYARMRVKIQIQSICGSNAKNKSSLSVQKHGSFYMKLLVYI